MKDASDEIRCLIAEWFLALALYIVPAKSREGRALANAVDQYAEDVESDAEVLKHCWGRLS